MFSVNFAKFLRTSFDKTPLDDCFLCLSLNFEKFFATPLLWSTSGKLLISCTSCRILTTRHSQTVKNYFTGAYQAFYTRTKSGHSKAFIYLKVQSCKLYNSKYMIASKQVTNTEIFAFIAVLVFKSLSHNVLFINRKDNRNC